VQVGLAQVAVVMALMVLILFYQEQDFLLKLQSVEVVVLILESVLWVALEGVTNIIILQLQLKELLDRETKVEIQVVLPQYTVEGEVAELVQQEEMGQVLLGVTEG
jgi:hypothetical protein